MRIIDHWETPLDKEERSYWVQLCGNYTRVGVGKIPDLSARVYYQVSGKQEPYNLMDERRRGGIIDMLEFKNRPVTQIYATELRCRETRICNEPHCATDNIFAIGSECATYNQWLDLRAEAPYRVLEATLEATNLPRWATFWYPGLLAAMNDPGLLLYYHHPKWPNSGLDLAAALDLPWTSRIYGLLHADGRTGLGHSL